MLQAQKLNRDVMDETEWTRKMEHYLRVSIRFDMGGISGLSYITPTSILAYFIVLLSLDTNKHELTDQCK